MGRNGLNIFKVPHFVFWGAIYLLAGCGAFHDKISPTTSAIRFSNFVSTVRPVLQSNCFSCHSQATNPAAVSFFMNSSDDITLYNESSRRIVSNNPGASALLLKGMNQTPHQGGNQLPGVADQDKIRNWINDIDSGSGGTGSGGGGTTGTNLRLTTGFVVPTGLTVNGNYRYMRFGLSGLGHPNAFVEMGVRYFTTGVYEFSQWRVYSPNYPLRISGLNIVVSQGATQNIVSTLGSVIVDSPQSQVADSSSNPLPGTPLLTQTALGLEIQAGFDEIKLGFTDVTRSTGGGSTTSADRAFFLASVKPILLTNCNSCHGNTSGSGNFTMPNNNDTILYQNVILKVIPRSPSTSPLYLKGTGVSHGGGNRLPNQTDRDTISNWINMIQ